MFGCRNYLTTWYWSESPWTQERDCQGLALHCEWVAQVKHWTKHWCITCQKLPTHLNTGKQKGLSSLTLRISSLTQRTKMQLGSLSFWSEAWHSWSLSGEGTRQGTSWLLSCCKIPVVELRGKWREATGDAWHENKMQTPNCKSEELPTIHTNT